MRIRRFISRRVWRFIQYFCLGGLLMIAVPTLINSFNGSSSPASANEAALRAEAHPRMPGMHVAPDADRPAPPPVNNDRLEPADAVHPPEGDKKKDEESGLMPLGPDDDEDPSKRFINLPRTKDWHDWEAMKKDMLRAGAGEQGKPVALPSDPETKKLEEQIYRVNGFDGLASDQISMNRSLKDIRHPGCKKMTYITKLPSVTVILPFHNEHNSTLLRSVYSVINRSPKDVLQEVVLVDDASTKDFLKAPLQEFVDRVFKGMVKIVRTGKREGLIRARQIGAQHATSEIMVFLDSHSEPLYNWIPPLVEPIALNYRTVVCPFVDVIDCDTFEYRAQDEGARGSFDWEFNYKRLPITDEDRRNPIKPFKSPVMAGGYFAINRKWFWELGGYDEGLDIWGGEQYELSFKVWQCHGQMFDAPCSRVGHIYRCKYVPFPNPGVGDFIHRNYKRVAEVWMDEYKEHLFKRRPVMKETNPGDLTKQKAVREKHKCKSFKWFMEEIAFDQDKFYPAIEPPNGAEGELRNIGANKCLDTQFKGKEDRFEIRPCIKDDSKAGGEQQMRFSFWHDLRPKDRSMCFDVSTSVKQAPVILFPCHGMQGNQMWRYRIDKQQLFHPVSAQCLDADAERGEIFMNPCDDSSETQKWKWEILNADVIKGWVYEKGF